MSLEDIREEFEDLFGPHVGLNGHILNSYLVMARRPKLLKVVSHPVTGDE